MEPIILRAAGNTLEVIPSLGGTIRQLSLTPISSSASEAVDPAADILSTLQDNHSKRGGYPLLRADEDAELEENPWFRGRFMFPFCDRIPGGRYTFGGKEYLLPVNQEDGSAIHGLIYNRPGRVSGRTTTSESDQIHLSWLLGQDAGYPFSVEFSLFYKLDSTGLSLRFLALNRGESPAPVGFGWHPYFSLSGIEVDEYCLNIPAESYGEVESNLMPTGRFPCFSLPEDQAEEGYDFRSSRRIGPDSYDIAYPVSPPARGVIQGKRLAITMDIGGALSFFQLFTPPDRRSVALEPVSNITDAFNSTDMGLRVLESGKRLVGLVRVELVELQA